MEGRRHQLDPIVHGEGGKEGMNWDSVQVWLQCAHEINELWCLHGGVCNVRNCTCAVCFGPSPKDAAHTHVEVCAALVSR